jgi:hypothetical protein
MADCQQLLTAALALYSIQCDSALRNTVRNYPYDVPGDDNEISLRGSSQEIAEKLREEIQGKVEMAALRILER